MLDKGYQKVLEIGKRRYFSFLNSKVEQNNITISDNKFIKTNNDTVNEFSGILFIQNKENFI